jgi:hypothetical protein
MSVEIAGRVLSDFEAERGRSSQFVPDASCGCAGQVDTSEVPVCNVVQRIPKKAAADGIELPLNKKADPVLPRSAVIDFDSDEFHTHEVTGSSPIAPTT